MSKASSPPSLDRHITLVGWTNNGNGRQCAEHIEGCGSGWVMCESNSVGTVVKLLKTDADQIKLACYAIKRTGEVGCRVAFTSKQYASEDLWQLYDGVTVCIVQMFLLPTSESKWERQLYHHNYGYAVGEVVQFANHIPNNNGN